MAKTLVILNDAPYGTERSYNGLRHAIALQKASGGGARVSHRRRRDMLGMVRRRGGKIGVCGTCMEAREITEADLVAGAHRSSMAELAEWHQLADKAIAF